MSLHHSTLAIRPFIWLWRLSWLPNGLRFTRAAFIDQEGVRTNLGFKIAASLGPRSGVGWKRGLGRRPIYALHEQLNYPFD